MKVQIKLLNKTSTLPQYATSGSAAVDLRSTVKGLIMPKNRTIIPTGIALQIPNGYVGLIFPRSGNAANNGVSLTNCVAVIDSDYRGEIKVLLINHGFIPFHINEGDRIAQMLFMPVQPIDFSVVDELNDTERGDGGFGSSGV